MAGFNLPGDTPFPHDQPKNRFISFATIDNGFVAYRVELLDLACNVTGKKCSFDTDCKTCTAGSNVGLGCSRNSDCPDGICLLSAETCAEQNLPVVLGWVSNPVEAPGDAPLGTFASTVSEEMPLRRFWVEDVVHIGDCEIAPAQTYGISATRGGSVFSQRLVIPTIEKPQGKFWADLVGFFNGVEWSAPNGLVNVDDLAAMLRFIKLKPAPHITVVDLVGDPDDYVNFIINAGDLQMVLEGFSGKTYPPAAYVGYPANLVDCP